MRTLTQVLIVVAAGLTAAAAWDRLGGITTSKILLYLVILFPYALFAVIVRQNGRHQSFAFGGLLAVAGLWLWVLLQDQASGGLSLFAAVIIHLVACTVLGLAVTVLGKRARVGRA